MLPSVCLANVLLALVCVASFIYAQDIGEVSTFLTSSSSKQMAPNQSPPPTTTSEVKTTTNTLISYSGSQLPSDWSLVSILNDRAVIGFKNGTSRNAQIDELDPSSKAIIQKLQEGSLSGAALKDKLSQWGTTVSKGVSSFGKSLKEQFGNVFGPSNSTSTVTTEVN